MSDSVSHPSEDAAAVDIDDALLRAWPLPLPGDDADKEERGRVLIVGGSREIPGAAVLAAVSALRAGAGKVSIATAEGIAGPLGLAVPEARVIGLPETADGGIAPAAVDVLAQSAARADALLIGPGMQDEAALCEFVQSLLSRIGAAKVVLDASGMGLVRERYSLAQADAGDGGRLPGRFLGRFEARVLLTPHAGEMAHLSGGSKEAVCADPAGVARAAARRWQASVALKGATTVIAAPDGRLWRHAAGEIGLATSGSGDTLAGIIAGLAARGASLEQACAWGVALHARAGARLAVRYGPLGYLARELPAEVPALMHALRAR